MSAQKAKGFSRRRRLLIAAGSGAALAALATFAAGAAFGLFSTTKPSGSSSFSSGSVTLARSAVHTCGTGPMAPGEASTGWVPAGADLECSFTITYTGTAPAFLGLDVSIAPTHAGSDPNGVLTGATGLYDSTSAGLQVAIKDSTGVAYMTGTTLGGSATSGANPSLNDLLHSATASTNGASLTYTVDYQLPGTTTNAYMQAASSITLTVHAVQASHNGSTVGCTPGRVCAGIQGWS